MYVECKPLTITSQKNNKTISILAVTPVAQVVELEGGWIEPTVLCSLNAEVFLRY